MTQQIDNHQRTGHLSRRVWLKFAGAGGLSLAGISFGPGRLSADDTAGNINIGSRLELMCDDYLVDRYQGHVELQLHCPTPREEAIRFDKPWEGNTTSYVEVFQYDGRYQMFYRGWHYHIGEQLAQAHSPMICYAESQDGIHWERPNLGLVPFGGSKDNNIVDLPARIGNYRTIADTFTVSIDENPDCPADARYKGVVLAMKPRGLIPMQSADGKRWKPVTDQHVITGDAFDSPNRLFWDSVRKEYRAYYRYVTSGESGDNDNRGIKTAVSKDLVIWSEGQILQFPDAPVDQLYTNMVFPYYRAPHLFVGFPTRYLDRGWSDSMRALPDAEHRQARARAMARVGTAMTDTMFMSSRDGLTFHRFGEAFIRPGPERPGTWNYGQTLASCPVVETESSWPGAPDELSFYVTEDYWTGQKGSALRRYSLRVDGFVSVRAKARGGEFVTKPLRFAGDRLRLNFATSIAGSIQVELQNAEGEPISGYTLEECAEIFGDSLSRAVSWKNGSDVSTLAEQPVRIRFVMKDADLYAFRFQPEDSTP